MPQTDKQQAKNEEFLRRFNASQFKRRWLWTALFGFNLTIALWQSIERRGQWRSVFLTPDFAQFTTPNSLGWAVFGVLVWTVLLIQFWQHACQYQREQERLAQERLMADTRRQTEDVWPPAPKNQEE